MRNGAAPPLCEARNQATTRSSGRMRFLRFCVEQYEQGGSVKAGNNPGPASTSSEAEICVVSPRQDASNTALRQVFIQADVERTSPDATMVCTRTESHWGDLREIRSQMEHIGATRLLNLNMPGGNWLGRVVTST